MNAVEVKAGDILLTRNAGGEDANPTPGYYNHSAIIADMNWVVESQMLPDSVIAVPVWDFFKRYPEVLVLRCLNDGVAKRTALVAPNFLGREYSKYMTIKPLWLWKTGDNCTSLIRRIYNAVAGYDYKWRTPDSLLKTQWLTKVALQKDYENYIPPEEYYKRAVKVWPNKPANDYM